VKVTFQLLHDIITGRFSNPFRGGASAGGGGARHRPDYSDYRGPGARPRYGSPVRDLPPAKRMRPDWGDGDVRANPRFGGEFY